MGSAKEECKLDGRRLSGSGESLQVDAADGIRSIEGSIEVLCQAPVGGLGSQLARVDVRSLPSVSFEQRKKLPNSRAIYFVSREDGELLYVGMTESLVLRWLNHHRFREFQRLEGLKIAWLIWEEAESLALVENFFINDLKPIFNIRRSPSAFVFEPVTNAEEFFELSYRDLQDRTQVDIRHWSRWFNGKYTPNLETLEKIAIALEIPVPKLVEAFLEKRSRTMQSKEVAKSA